MIAFYTGKADAAHISFVKEAKPWFARMAAEHHFSFESTQDWDNLNREFLAPYQVVVFLDTRPDSPRQREAFQEYMKNGGAWMGFHFSAFALTPSKYPQNWDWYHNEFLGSGMYVGNTWRPTSAILRVEDTQHPATVGLPATFRSAPNEWYKWSNGSENQPEYPDPGLDRSGQLPPGHRAEEARNLAQRILSRRLDKPEIPHDLLQHGP